MLTNPCYAGAYAFGRTYTRTAVIDGRPHKTHGHRQAREHWIALLRDHHEAYIPWDIYERNQQLIAHNAQMKGLMVRGTVRRGPSLLPGLPRCGHCGRRLHVSYSGVGGYVPRYSCQGATLNHGADRCISFGELRVDEAKGREVLRLLTPGAIEAACRLADAGVEERAVVRQAVELELREARYEAERARRQYDAVEPEHRLVATTLEQRWNAALARVHDLEERIAALTADAERQVAPDRVVLLRLAEDSRASGITHPRISGRARASSGCSSRKIVVKVVPGTREQIELTIHWKGGRHTQLMLPRNRTGQHRRSTDRAVVDVVRDLARAQSDGDIARVLNRFGYRTGAGNTWTALRVLSLRRSHGIAAFERTSDRRDVLTIADAAAMLGGSATTVRRMIVLGILPATQPVVRAPWAIRQQDLDLDAVQRAVHAIKTGRALPRSPDGGQLTLTESTT
jgi:hypothetical protein